MVLIFFTIFSLYKHTVQAKALLHSKQLLQPSKIVHSFIVIV